MDLPTLQKILIKHEGVRLKVYDDANAAAIVPGYTLIGHPTIGCGRALDVNGISRREWMMMLNQDIISIYRDLDRSFPWFRKLSETRRIVLISMAFNLGVHGVKAFRRMVSALALSQFTMAAAEMLNSEWAKQVPERALELSTMMKTDH